MEFKPARLDRPASIITVLTVVLLTAMSALFIMNVPKGWGFALFSMGLVLGCYLFSVKSYRFEGGNLVIEKIIGQKTVVPIGEIQSYLIVDNFLTLKPLRAFGNGGLFGYYGLFTTHDYGKMSCYLTRLRQIVMIKTRRGIVVLSPENPVQFESHFTAVVHGAAGTIEKIQPTAPENIRYASPWILLLPDAIFTLNLIGVILLYPALPAYIATHFNFQGVADSWSPKSSFLFMSMLPAFVIFALTILMFFVIRRRTPEPTITYFIVGLFSFIQFFIGFVFFDVFWFNIRHEHLLPLHFLLFIFLAAVFLGIYFFYQRIRKT
jgi:hypothetical protein